MRTVWRSCMTNFINLKHFTTYNLDDTLDDLLTSGKISWKIGDNQIGINTLPGHEQDVHCASGSLIWDWHNAIRDEDDNVVDVPKFAAPRQESDFTVLCTQFIGTPFEDLYTELNQHYHVGRVRLMRSEPKTCLTWHLDHHPRVHYPIQTAEGCLMVIHDEVKYLPQNTWWYTNTTIKHTAFNGSSKHRIHLVATILSER